MAKLHVIAQALIEKEKIGEEEFDAIFGEVKAENTAETPAAEEASDAKTSDTPNDETAQDTTDKED